jgi:hypothetical protein
VGFLARGKQITKMPFFAYEQNDTRPFLHEDASPHGLLSGFCGGFRRISVSVRAKHRGEKEQFPHDKHTRKSWQRPLTLRRSRRRHSVRVDCARRTAEIGGRKKEHNARGHDDGNHQQRTEILLPCWPKRKLIGNPGHAMNLPPLP